MSQLYRLVLTRFTPRKAALIATIIAAAGMPNEANALTGKEVLEKLDTDSQFHYVSGILVGLGYARFLQDKPDQAGMKCIQEFLTEGGVEKWNIAEQWLENNKDLPAGVIIYAMTAKECGK